MTGDSGLGPGLGAELSNVSSGTLPFVHQSTVSVVMMMMVDPGTHRSGASLGIALIIHSRLLHQVHQGVTKLSLL